MTTKQLIAHLRACATQEDKRGGGIFEREVELEAANKIEELHQRLGCVVRNAQYLDETLERGEPGPLCGPTWAKVAHLIGYGSHSAIDLCKEHGVDPHYDFGRRVNNKPQPKKADE